MGDRQRPGFVRSGRLRFSQRTSQDACSFDPPVRRHRNVAERRRRIQAHPDRRPLQVHDREFAPFGRDERTPTQSTSAPHRPGGNFEEIGKGLAPSTSATIRGAVQGGLHYLGACAGAFFAGDSPYNGLNLTSGVRFGFYSLEGRGVRKAAVRIVAPGSQALDHYWEDGPELTGWGDVVAKYPDGPRPSSRGRSARDG
jgi:hypothetical protein